MATEGLPKTCPKSDLEKGPPDSGKPRAYGRIPVAPLPPITCSGKPAPKSDNGNASADVELETTVEDELGKISSSLRDQ